MKIFDDRFMDIPNLYDEDGLLEDIGELSHWFQAVLTAEWHVRGELTAFEKMEMAQGSLIPYFYGAHKVRQISLDLRFLSHFCSMLSSDWLMATKCMEY